MEVDMDCSSSTSLVFLYICHRFSHSVRLSACAHLVLHRKIQACWPEGLKWGGLCLAIPGKLGLAPAWHRKFFSAVVSVAAPGASLSAAQPGTSSGCCLLTELPLLKSGLCESICLGPQSQIKDSAPKTGIALNILLGESPGASQTSHGLLQAEELHTPSMLLLVWTCSVLAWPYFTRTLPLGSLWQCYRSRMEGKTFVTGFSIAGMASCNGLFHLFPFATDPPTWNCFSQSPETSCLPAGHPNIMAHIAPTLFSWACMG